MSDPKVVDSYFKCPDPADWRVPPQHKIRPNLIRMIINLFETRLIITWCTSKNWAPKLSKSPRPRDHLEESRYSESNTCKWRTQCIPPRIVQGKVYLCLYTCIDQTQNNSNKIHPPRQIHDYMKLNLKWAFLYFILNRFTAQNSGLVFARNQSLSYRLRGTKGQ